MSSFDYNYITNNNSDSLDEHAFNILLDLFEPNTNPKWDLETANS